MNDTKTIYNQNAYQWDRNSPNSLSDFTARPYIFDLCGNVEGKSILDIGCGEGYCSRYLKQNKKAGKIIGIDISEKMVEIAKAKNNKLGLDIHYIAGDINDYVPDESSIDLALGIFVYNYLDIQAMQKSMEIVFKALKKSGRFIFAVPHPTFPFISKSLEPPFFFDFKENGYFSGRDQRHYGSIFCLDGKELPVQMVHKLYEDYYFALAKAGFEKMPFIKELKVTKEHFNLYPDFFSPLSDLPLHLVFSVEK